MNNLQEEWDSLNVSMIRTAASLLFDTAREWLKSRGMEAMDGPINFGETDKYWGLAG